MSEVTRLLDASSELVRTLEQLNMSLREGRSLQVSPRTLEAIADLKGRLTGLLTGPQVEERSGAHLGLRAPQVLNSSLLSPFLNVQPLGFSGI